MSAPSPVDRLYAEATAIIVALGASEPSLQTAAADSLRKALVLAAASYFEREIIGCVMDFVEEQVGSQALVVSFVRNKAVDRQYHTWFNWRENNANQFFGLFGKDFKDAMARRVRESEQLTMSVRAFLELGNIRNQLVHQDFAAFSLDKTLDEIYGIYQHSRLFVEELPIYFREAVAAGVAPRT